MRIPLDEPLQASQEGEAALHAREERLQVSLDAANVGTWDWNVRTGDVHWSENLERIHGQQPGAFRGTFDGFLDGVHPDDRQPVLDAIQRALTTGETYEAEYRSLRPDGTAMWLTGRGHVFREGGEPAWMSGICMDTTERHQLQEQLRHTQRLESVGVLAGGIAHDFNNLLTGVLGNASLLQDRFLPDSREGKAARDLITASHVMAKLTSQMLAYSGRGRFVIERLDLSAVVRQITNLVQVSIPKSVRFVLAVGEGLPAIEGDSSQIQQVVMNLVINAAEALGSEQGTVEVRTLARRAEESELAAGVIQPPLSTGEYIVLEVRDTGPGMDEATRSRIFDPFFTTKFTGRGLGLSAVLGIVRAHHGTLIVESCPGSGTTFRIFFPCPAACKRTAPPERAASHRGSGTILVVDDEDIILRMAQSVLDEAGYDVLGASNGSEALDVYAAQSGHIDAVLLDMTMPVMGGEETMERLSECWPDATVIATSGYDLEEAERRFGTRHAGFLQKPYTADQLTAKIAEAVRSRA